MREAAHLLAIRIDDHVRDLAIERIASRIELLHAHKRIGSLQQWSVLAVAGALPQRGGRCMEIEHGSGLLEPLAVRWTQHNPASGGKHDIALDDEVGEHGCFALAKARLSFQFEDDRNRHAQATFELDVGVEERLVQTSGEHAAERRLAATRHAHQKKIAPMQMHRGIVHCSLTTIRARIVAGSRLPDRRNRFLDDPWREEDQELGLVELLARLLENVAKNGYVSEERDLGDVVVDR